MLKLAGVALLTGFLCVEAFAFDGPAPPQSLPFTQGGKTYNAYVQTWHPHYAQSNICYYPTNYDPSLAPVLATDGVIQFGYLSITRLLLNPTSQNQSWDSSLFASDGPLCAMFSSGAWNDPLSTPTRLFYQQYSWNDWYFNDQYNYNLNLTTDLVRAVGIDVRSNFTHDYAGQFALGQVVAGQVVVAGSPPPPPPPPWLSFRWPVDPLNMDAGKYGPCADWSGDPVGCYWLSSGATNPRTTWRDAQPFQRHLYSVTNGWHLGADYNLSKDAGRDVYPAAPGKVAAVVEDKCGWGNVIFVRHTLSNGDPITTMYAHVAWLPSGKPNADVNVSPEAPIARVGTAWRAKCGGKLADYPPHLHFELRESTSTELGKAYTADQLPVGEKGPEGQVDPNAFISTHR